MNNELNFGLDLELNEEHKNRESNYIAGVVDKEVLREDGQWLDFEPECEIQKSTDGDDRMNCVSNSESNARKLLMLRKFNININPSQRFRAKMSGTTRRGNSLYAVADSARHHGFVEDVDWPENVNLNWYQYYMEIPTKVKEKGVKTTLQFDVNYEQVPTTHSALMDNLRYAPIQVIGYAWASKDGIYYDYGNRPNHAFLLVGYVKGKYWIVYDSYPTDYQIDNNSTKQEFIKHLDWDFKFSDALLYTIKLKQPETSWLYKIINMLKNLKMNFWKNKDNPAEGLANGEIYICKNGKKKKVDDINDVMAVLEINFGIEKTDWGELGQYETVDKL